MFGVVVKLRLTYMMLKMFFFEFRDRVIIKPWRTEGVGALTLRKKAARNRAMTQRSGLVSGADI